MQKKYFLTNSMQGVSSVSRTYCQVSFSLKQVQALVIDVDIFIM